jgi:hypothetical protein
MGTRTAHVVRIGVAIIATILTVISTAACSNNAKAAKPLTAIEKGEIELSLLMFASPGPNPDLKKAKSFPWIAGAGTCTLYFTKESDEWIGYLAVRASFHGLANVIELRHASLDNAKANPELKQQCFPVELPKFEWPPQKPIFV